MRGSPLPATLAALIAISWASAEPTPASDAPLSAYGETRQSIALADGRSIHLVCMGEGSPTVILTAGLGDWSAIWSKVQPAVAKRTRVCAWDRPGFGFSSASPAVQTADNTSRDLAAALSRGRLAGPYILVGHSMGSYESLLFADSHPDAVSGMVLVDPSFPDQARHFERVAPAFSAFFGRLQEQEVSRLLQCEADLTAGRLSIGGKDPGACHDAKPEYPPRMSAALARCGSLLGRFKTAASLTSSFSASSERLVKPGRSYGAMPLVVLTALATPALPPETPEPAKAEVPALQAEWVRAHNELATLSSMGRHQLFADFSHYIHTENPAAVVAAIIQVIDQSAAPFRDEDR